jgi:hypothetical protein
MVTGIRTTPTSRTGLVPPKEYDKLIQESSEWSAARTARQKEIVDELKV